MKRVHRLCERLKKIIIHEAFSDLRREIEQLRTLYVTSVNGNGNRNGNGSNGQRFFDKTRESDRLKQEIYDEFWKSLSHDGKLFIQKNDNLIDHYVELIFLPAKHRDKYNVKEFVRLNPPEELLDRIERYATIAREGGTL